MAKLTQSIKFKRSQLDPRTLLLFLLIFNIIYFSQQSPIIQYGAIILALMALIYSDKWRLSFHICGMYMILKIMGKLLSSIQQPFMSGFALMFLTVTHFFPLVIVAILLTQTVRVSSLMYVLRKWHCPAIITIAIALVIRFFPTVKEQWQMLQVGLSVRGVHFSWLHPLGAMQLILVPMITNLSLVADELSAAATARGIGGVHLPSTYWPTRFHVADFFFVGIILILLILSILSREGALL